MTRGAANQDRDHQRQVKDDKKSQGLVSGVGPPHLNAGNSYSGPGGLGSGGAVVLLRSIGRITIEDVKALSLAIALLLKLEEGGSSTNMSSLVSLVHADNARDQLG